MLSRFPNLIRWTDLWRKSPEYKFKGENLKNVFELWMENDKNLPFKVRRFSWHPETFFLVKKIDAKWDYYEKTGKLYGKAYGDMYLKGKLASQDISLNCIGCYQWELLLASLH